MPQDNLEVNELYPKIERRIILGKKDKGILIDMFKLRRDEFGNFESQFIYIGSRYE